MTLKEARTILGSEGIYCADYQKNKRGRPPTQWVHPDYQKVKDALAVYAEDQVAQGWRGMPEWARGLAVSRTLHTSGRFKIDFKRSLPFQAYYSLLTPTEQNVSRQLNNFVPCF